MPSRVHFIDNQNTRITASVGRIWLFFYQEWSASLRIEEKHQEIVFLNPLSWFTRTTWKPADASLAFSSDFVRGDGQVIDQTLLNPYFTKSKGYLKVWIVYASVGASSDDLGIDARSVANVKMTYIIEGIERSLSRVQPSLVRLMARIHH